MKRKNLKEEHMKNKKSIDIIVVLDRSGSMQSIKEQTISGFNEFLQDQKKNNKGASITLVQFDHEFEMVYEAREIKRARELNTMTYVPRGMTALLDAIGKTIKLTRQRHKQLEKPDRPEKTIFVIITDGYENSSTVFTRQDIFKKITKMENKHNWDFVYLGANQDAIREAAHYGIKEKKAMTFAADAVGTRDMFHDISYNISRSVLHDKAFAFKDEQRAKQKRNPENN
jgi:Mg-chelatase subunit ChlD